MSRDTFSPAKLELVVVRLGDDDCVETLALLEERDRSACQRVRPIRRRRLFHFRRAALLALLARLRQGSTVLRDTAGHVRALLYAGEARYVSSTASGAVCAMTICDRPVGIDIERSDAPADLVSLLDFIGAPCAAAIKVLPPGIAAFEARMVWTRLEAGLKQMGRGIHDYIAHGPTILPEGPGVVHVLATFDWTCAVVHAGEPIEIAPRVIDFRTLADA